MSGSLAKGFLDDIVANIDDDTPRLVYADWLAENGQDDRAEFIRVQIQRARLPSWEGAQVRLRLREQELLSSHGESWLAELPVIEGATWQGFRRGIIAEVSFASFEAMRANAHACRAVAPVEAMTVRWPRKDDVGQEVAPIAELRELVLTGRPNLVDEIGWLADSPQLSTLRTLAARGLWPHGMTRLVASPHFGSLKRLRLPVNNLGNDGILALVQATSLTCLEELDLSGLGVTERYNEDPLVRAPGMDALTNWVGLRKVRSLRLEGNELGRAGIRTLVRSPNATALKDLSLHNGYLDGEALAELADAHPDLRLETLDLGENALMERGVEHLAAALCLRELKTLWLDRCEVPLAGARRLVKSAMMESLRILGLRHNYLGPVGLTELLAREPPMLHTLLIRDNDLFDKGVAALAGSPASDRLLEVDLSRNSLGSGAVQTLATTTHLRNLVVLRLADNPISEEMAQQLAASPLGQRLASLEMQDAPPPPDPDEDENVPMLPPMQAGEDDIPF